MAAPEDETNSKLPTMLPRNSALLADSIEVQRAYHLSKLKLLEDELTRLNILEHPREIREICSTIIDIKRSLEKIGSSNQGSK